MTSARSLTSLLKRIRQLPRQEGSAKFVRIGALGPLVDLPVSAAEEIEDDPAKAEEYFRAYYERQRRFSRGIEPNAEVDQSKEPGEG
jgi:hypothetical protein